MSLIHQHRGIIHKVCSLYGSSPAYRQDLYQEILAQLWKAFPRFRGDAKISTWIYRVALNTAITDFRKQQRTLPSISMEVTDVQDIAEEASDIRERLALIHKAIENLSQIEKAIVMLYLDDTSYEEMEEVLGISQNTLRVKMNRIRGKLRKQVTAGDLSS